VMTFIVFQSRSFVPPFPLLAAFVLNPLIPFKTELRDSEIKQIQFISSSSQISANGNQNRIEFQNSKIPLPVLILIPLASWESISEDSRHLNLPAITQHPWARTEEAQDSDSHDSI